MSHFFSHAYKKFTKFIECTTFISRGQIYYPFLNQTIFSQSEIVIFFLPKLFEIPLFDWQEINVVISMNMTLSKMNIDKFFILCLTNIKKFVTILILTSDTTQARVILKISIRCIKYIFITLILLVMFVILRHKWYIL